MAGALPDLVTHWMSRLGIDPSRAPDRYALETGFPEALEPCRPGASPAAITAWEARHGYRFPAGLRAWLQLSNGLYRSGPLIHPISAIGPMIPFARVPEMIVQPESWFELGNPPTEPMCMDLAYTWPGGCCPVFTSGDDERQTQPRVIGPSFETWFLRLLHEGGREYWLEPAFSALGDPWAEHRRHTPAPELPPRLLRLAPRVRPLMHPGADDRALASSLGITRGDLEAIFRHLQHAQ